MQAWLARYTIVAGLSQITCCSEPPCLRTLARVIQSGKYCGTFFCMIPGVVMPSG